MLWLTGWRQGQTIDRGGGQSYIKVGVGNFCAVITLGPPPPPKKKEVPAQEHRQKLTNVHTVKIGCQ